MNYSPKESAQGLASLGRYGDTMLVHMNPEEVAGLQSLAMSKGGSLTINPDTGMPEAFILPLLGGAALSKFMSPIAAGLLIGGATALTTGDIGEGIMAGFGGFGGADLGKIFAKMGASGGIPVGAGTDIAKAGIAESLPIGASQNLSMFTPSGTFGNQTMNAALTGSSVGSSAIPSAISPTTIGPGVNSATNAMGAAPTSTQIAESTLTPPATSGTYGNMGKGFGQLFDDGGFEAFKVAGGEGGIPLETGDAAMKLGAPVGGAALSLYQPPMPEPYIDPDTGKYRGPQGQLNLGDQFDTGLRLAAGGAVGNPSVGQGISDLYNRPEGQASEIISQDGYGIGRLNSLANAEAMNNAKTLGYADGGEVGMNLDDNTLNLNLAGKPSNSESGSSPVGAYSPNMGMPGGVNGMGYGNSNLLQALFGGLKREPKSYALNVNTGKQEPQYAEGAQSTGSFLNMLQGLGGLGGSAGLGYSPLNMIGLRQNATPEPKSYSLNVNSGKQEAQGKAQGGYLDGQGDGMSDSIPATIEGKQPARLADGEFVVPADVVSHLGNGSSKAGSKRLYAMLDKVRHARTGNKKQGKEIKADKYLPA